jgi:hypothetical protein
MRATTCLLLFGCLSWSGFERDLLGVDFPGPGPGAAQVQSRDGQLELRNQALSCAWSVVDGKLKPKEVFDRIGGSRISAEGTELFRLTLSDGRSVVASDLRVVGEPELGKLPANTGASVLAQRFAGRRIVVRLASADSHLEVEWRAILRDGGNAVRQELILTAKGEAISAKEIRLMEMPAAGARVVGSVPGSPAVAGNFFFACEHPDSQSAVEHGPGLPLATCAIKFDRPLGLGQSVLLSSVIGVVPEGQLRRGFLYYVERERAHPYRPFLHYNSWYDVCWGDLKIREQDCLQVIEDWGREAIEKRGIKLASFVWDDGWDDPNTLWQASSASFPNGFSSALAAARKYNSTLGFWLSPFGGYGQPAKDRLAMGKERGFEFGPQGFSLAGSNYYARFQETCLSMIQSNGANFFKFDGLARSLSETEAMLRLSRALRQERPDLFLSITTGTWPSPFWLWYGDSTWRGGGDMGLAGEGSKREQWMTYRDRETYRNVVQAAPLYPLNSLMNQGFAQAKHGSASENGNSAEEIRRELRSFFACGTCLQELYASAGMMTGENWDDLAETSGWSQQNAEVLADTHWIGGDPGKGEVYGWASWSGRKGVLGLRNPTAKAQAISVDIGQAFDLPVGGERSYRLRSPWKSDTGRPGIGLRAGVLHSFALEPFEVLVLEARSGK